VAVPHYELDVRVLGQVACEWMFLTVDFPESMEGPSPEGEEDTRTQGSRVTGRQGDMQILYSSMVDHVGSSVAPGLVLCMLSIYWVQFIGYAKLAVFKWLKICLSGLHFLKLEFSADNF
jgi:hypothetical protein